MKPVFGFALFALAAYSQAAESEPSDVMSAPETVSTKTGCPSAPFTAPAAPKTDYTGPIPMPILIGSDGPDMDACGAYAQVANLNRRGDNYLSVRDAPNVTTKERDRLAPGQGVTVCASKNGWSGVVYAKTDDEEQDCGTSSPVASVQPYRGPCRQGWVSSRYLEMIAG